MLESLTKMRLEAKLKMKRDDVLKKADGRVFTGKQAFEMGLVDTLGTLEDAIKIAENLAGIK